MSYISSASSNSKYRGYDYYKENKIRNIKKVDDNKYSAVVLGSNGNKYDVCIDTLHPKKDSHCTCLHAEDNKVMCKHKVGLYFSVFEDEAKQYIEEVERQEQEYEEYQENLDNTFDGVIAFYSLFHIPKEDFNNVLIQIKNVMKNGGLFAFVVQLGKGESMIDEPYLMEKGRKSLYMNYFVKENLLENLKNIGFDVIYYNIKREIGENELGDIGNDKLLVLAKINK